MRQTGAFTTTTQSPMQRHGRSRQTWLVHAFARHLDFRQYLHEFTQGAPAGPTPASAWRTHTAADGRQYYEDTINKKTQWDMPEVLKAAQAQAQTPARSQAAPFVASPYSLPIWGQSQNANK